MRAKGEFRGRPKASTGKEKKSPIFAAKEEHCRRVLCGKKTGLKT